MKSTRSRLIAGLAAGVMLAAGAPILANVGRMSGVLGGFSGNVGPLSANIGLLSGSISAGSGNIGLLSGNRSALALAGAAMTRGAAAYFVDRPVTGGVRVLYVQAAKRFSAYAGARTVGAAYKADRRNYGFAYYVECNIGQQGCTYASFYGSADGFKIGPAIKYASYSGVMTNRKTGAPCKFQVNWTGGQPEAGYWHYGGGDLYNVWEGAAADAYRRASAIAESSCFDSFETDYGWTYLDLQGYGYATQSLVPRR